MRIFGLSLLLDREPMIFEDGQQIRDYINIQDVVAANLTEELVRLGHDVTLFASGGA